MKKSSKFAETLVFVPFFGGNQTQLKKHIELAQSLGFKTEFIALDEDIKSLFTNVFSANRGLGFKHVWADRIESELNRIPGNKIVFAMSNPASGAIEAIARRSASDITALICEGGPTDNFWESIVNYLTFEKPIGFKPARWAVAAATTVLWTPDFRNSLHKDIERLPENFPILSIRGWKDPLIEFKDIDAVFEGHNNIDWQKLSLPEAGHLNGLKDYTDDYVEPVKKFLGKVATHL